MNRPPVHPLNFQGFVAERFLGQNLAAGKEFLIQGAQDVRNVASTVLEWYQNLEPGRFMRWYQSPEFKESLDWFIAMSKTPQAEALVMTWLVVFFVVYVLVAHRLGFGARGVVASSIAAAWQSYAYGAFTPLGSVFAFLTSMGMMGKMQLIAAITGAIVATIAMAGVFVGVWGSWNEIGVMQVIEREYM